MESPHTIHLRLWTDHVDVCAALVIVASSAGDSARGFFCQNLFYVASYPLSAITLTFYPSGLVSAHLIYLVRKALDLKHTCLIMALIVDFCK